MQRSDDRKPARGRAALGLALAACLAAGASNGAVRAAGSAQEPVETPPPKPIEAPPPKPIDEPIETPQESLSDPYASLLARFEEAREAHKQAIREERDPEKRSALRLATAERAFLPEFEALVAAGDGRGLLWIARHARTAGLPREAAASKAAAAWRSLAHDYLTAPWLGEALEAIKRHRAEVGRSVAVEHLRHVHDSTPSVELKAHAAHLLAQVFESSEDEAELASRAEYERLLAADYAGTAYARALAAAAKAREEAARPDAEVRVDPPVGPPPTLGVVLGQFAPEVSGVDADGREITLATVEGKVTVVVFFGFWDPPARKVLEALKVLDEELGDLPFTVLGIDAGDSAIHVKDWTRSLELEWPIVVQGLAEAPISERWGVRDYPETYVLDAKGRVAARAKGAELRKVVERELAKLRAE